MCLGSQVCGVIPINLIGTTTLHGEHITTREFLVKNHPLGFQWEVTIVPEKRKP
jgi:hypothetical protein